VRNIFIGFLLIFLDFNLDINTCRIGLIPDFIGYIILINGLKEMTFESKCFEKIKPFVAGMGVYSSILYAMDLFGLSANLSGFGVLLGIASTIISLYISYVIIEGVRNTEINHNADLNSASLKSTWTLMAVFQTASYVSSILPALAIICIIVSFIVAILFLVQFNRSKNLYEAL
jgi:hypothetical protein